MDVFTIFKTLWRYKRLTISVAVLTLIVMAYILTIQTATYQAKSEVLLTNPPVLPSTSQAANPLANLGNLTYVADVLIDIVNDPVAKDALTAEGVTGYQVALDSSASSNIPPAIDINGTGSTAQEAMQSAQRVTDAMIQDLNTLQKEQSVPAQYAINVTEYVTPKLATKLASGKLQKAIAALAIGLIALLVAVSIAQGREQHKRDVRQEVRRDYPPDVNILSTGRVNDVAPGPDLPRTSNSPRGRPGDTYSAGPGYRG